MGKSNPFPNGLTVSKRGKANAINIKTTTHYLLKFDNLDDNYPHAIYQSYLLYNIWTTWMSVSLSEWILFICQVSKDKGIRTDNAPASHKLILRQLLTPAIIYYDTLSGEIHGRTWSNMETNCTPLSLYVYFRLRAQETCKCGFAILNMPNNITNTEHVPARMN